MLLSVMILHSRINSLLAHGLEISLTVIIRSNQSNRYLKIGTRVPKTVGIFDHTCNRNNDRYQPHMH